MLSVLLVLPALTLTVAVLGVGVGSVAAQSVGLLPVVGESQFGWDAWLAARDLLGSSVGVSLAIAAVATAIALAVGFAAALLVTRSRLGGRAVAVLAASTVPIPHLVGAAAIGLLLADSGLVPRVLGAAPGTFPALVAGPAWVAVVLEYAWKESAFVAIVVLGSLAGTENELDEAAAVLGAGPLSRIRRVTLPVVAPALVVSGTISFAYVIGSYEVPWLLGRSHPEPLPVLAFRLFGDTDLTTRPVAMAVATTAVVIATASLVVGGMLLSRVARAR